MLNNFSKIFPTVCKQSKKGAPQNQSAFVKLSSEIKLHSQYVVCTKNGLQFDWLQMKEKLAMPQLVNHVHNL